MKFHTGYFDDAVFDLPKVIDQARDDLRGVRFDTIVGTGFSGGVVIPALAIAMGKQFVLIRKDGDNSHHRGTMIGQLGDRWIFVDDFIVTGQTRRRVVDEIARVSADCGIRTEMVGQYLYQSRTSPKLSPYGHDWAEGG